MIPFWVKVAMFAAFFAIMGAWAWLARVVWHEWLPKPIAIVLGSGCFAFSLGYFICLGWQRWRPSTPRRLSRRR